MTPLVSEVAMSEPEIEMDAPAKHDLMSSTAEESLAVSTSEPEISYAFEETPATIDHSLLAESGGPDDENAVIQSASETIEPKAIEAEHMFPSDSVEDKTDVADDKTSDSAQILAAAQHLPEVASRDSVEDKTDVADDKTSDSAQSLVAAQHLPEVASQPQSTGTAAVVTKDVLDNRENQVEIDDTFNIEPIAESDVAEHIEAAENESPLEDVPSTSSTKESENIIQLEPEVDFAAPAEEESITQVAAGDLLPKIKAPGETIDYSVTNVEAPVDIQSEHAAVVETSCTDELAGVFLPPPDVEESPETSTAQVEPSLRSSDEEMKGVSVLFHFQLSMQPRSLNLLLFEEPCRT